MDGCLISWKIPSITGCLYWKRHEHGLWWMGDLFFFHVSSIWHLMEVPPYIPSYNSSWKIPEYKWMRTGVPPISGNLLIWGNHGGNMGMNLSSHDHNLRQLWGYIICRQAMTHRYFHGRKEVVFFRSSIHEMGCEDARQWKWMDWRNDLDWSGVD